MTPRRRWAAWIAGSAAVFAHEGVLHACPVCFRIEEGPTTAGVYAAVLVLVGVTTGVLGGFAAFIVRFVRRAGRQP
jgi:heme/copper-type cytochrome/quinol oxidase subunit 2